MITLLLQERWKWPSQWIKQCIDHIEIIQAIEPTEINNGFLVRTSNQPIRIAVERKELAEIQGYEEIGTCASDTLPNLRSTFIGSIVLRVQKFEFTFRSGLLLSTTSGIFYVGVRMFVLECPNPYRLVIEYHT